MSWTSIALLHGECDRRVLNQIGQVFIGKYLCVNSYMVHWSQSLLLL